MSPHGESMLHSTKVNETINERVKSQSLCKIIRGHAASLYDRNSVSLS